MRAFIVSMLILLFAFTLSCLAQTPTETSIFKTKKLLEQLRRESISAMMIPPEQSVMREIERTKPAAELRLLYDHNDRSVLALGGFWASVCMAVDPSICVPDLIRDLKHSDPEVKAFACENLGVLKPPSAVTPLKEALKDTEIVPAYAGRPEVAVFAAQALASFGYADGIDVMLAHAEREGSEWFFSYKKIFGQLSGKKFSKDLRVWRKWFQEHRSTLKYAP